MPINNPDHIEYTIINGHVQIVVEGGRQLPAYWAHPDLGGTFPGVVLIHDWWGITSVERRLAGRFAQSGYYVIVPDLFNGSTAATPQEAIALVEALGDSGYQLVDTALTTLEQHVRCSRDVAAVGLGMGGTLAFHAALTRVDLESAVACYGFPQRMLGQFGKAQAPIMAIYGEHEPHVDPTVIARLRAELRESPLDHQVVTLAGSGREFFEQDTAAGAEAWRQMLTFIESHHKHTRTVELPDAPL